MGMSTCIMGFRSEDDLKAEFDKHKPIFDLCRKSGISLPKETQEFFSGEKTDFSDFEDDLEIDLIRGKHYEEYSEDMRYGFEVDLQKLPKEVKKLRFYNLY